MISIIAAVARNRAIGYKNKLIYWLPNDLKRFKQLTTGHTIIMGRNTYLSLPKGALPNRRNVVLSRSAFNDNDNDNDNVNVNDNDNVNVNANHKDQSSKLKAQSTLFPGCDVYPSLEAALQSCKADEDVYIIGGARVYQQAMAVADRLCLTEVDDTPEHADAFFPDYSLWQEEWREEHDTDDRHAYRYAFVDYVNPLR